MRPAGPLFLSVENSRTLSPALIEAESSYQSPPSRSYPRDALRRIADAVGSPSMTHGIPRETLDGGLGRPRALALRFFGCQSLRHLRSRRILGTTLSRGPRLTNPVNPSLGHWGNLAVARESVFKLKRIARNETFPADSVNRFPYDFRNRQVFSFIEIQGLPSCLVLQTDSDSLLLVFIVSADESREGLECHI